MSTKSSKPQFGFALEYVTDIRAAKRFYVDILGLEIERHHPTFVQFKNFAIASDESMGGRGEPARAVSAPAPIPTSSKMS